MTTPEESRLEKLTRRERNPRGARNTQLLEAHSAVIQELDKPQPSLDIIIPHITSLEKHMGSEAYSWRPDESGSIAGAMQRNKSRPEARSCVDTLGDRFQQYMTREDKANQNNEPSEIKYARAMKQRSDAATAPQACATKPHFLELRLGEDEKPISRPRGSRPPSR